jgi:outer membrane protein assembly factor BamE (lipoprotein component of BamABCDE complex)
MKTKLTIIGLVALLAAGCYTQSTQLNKVHLGMSEAEVVKILGEPVSRAESKDGTTSFYYSLQEIFGSPPVPYSIKLVNGKVDSYGRDDGATQTRQPMPVIVPMAH